MSVNDMYYEKLFGEISENEAQTMARCACVACNRCTCACSCRKIDRAEEIEW